MSEPTRLSVGIRDVSFGERVKLVEPVNLYGCTLADDVFVGPFVEIQSNVSIGRATRIQSHSFICEHVTIGERCFIGHGVMFANDLFQSGAPTRIPPVGAEPTLGMGYPSVQTPPFCRYGYAREPSSVPAQW